MHHTRPLLRQFQRTTLGLAIAAAFAPISLANPVAPTVASGSATFSSSGSTLTVVNTPGTIINWQQFNIGQNEITRFIQQNAQSTVLNRITGQDPSQILGTLQSNGRVFLINPNGILFGQGAVIDVFGLVASNLNLSNADFLAGRFSFSGGGMGAVINQGAITTPVGGSVYLIGSSVGNQGLITSPKGEVLLAAGNSVSLADTGTPSMSVTLSADANRAVNLGQITAEGGRIDIYGALISQQGILRADSAAADAQGRIVLKASQRVEIGGEISATNSAGPGGTVQVLGDEVSLGATAKIDASGATGGGTVLIGGDYQGKNAAIQNANQTTIAAGATIRADALDAGNGGRVIVWANDKTFYDGFISARGGANGGDGGFVETSGHSLQVATGRVDTLAPRGKTGLWLLDPAGLCISDSVCTGTLLGTPVSYDSTMAPATLDAALTSSNVALSATDFLVYQPLGAYTVGGGVPVGRSLGFYAPYIYFNGTLDATGKSLHMEIKASGTSATLNGVGGSSRIDFGSSANLITGGGNLRISASNSSLSVDIAAGASVNAGTGSIDLAAWKINTSGTPSFTAKEMKLETGKITGQISVTADFMLVDPWGYETGGTMNTYLGVNNADARCAVSLCLLNQLTGTVSKGLEIASSNNLYVEGAFSNPSPRLALVADHGTLYLNAPLSVTGLESEPVAAILGGEKGFVNNAGANAITTTYGRWAIITADPASLVPGGLVAASQLALASVFGVDYANEDAFWTALMAKLNPAAAAGNIFGFWALQLIDPCQVTPDACAPAKPETPAVVNEIVVADTSGTKGIVTYEEKLVTTEKAAKAEKKDERKAEGKRAEAKEPGRKTDGLRRARQEDERKSAGELKEEAKQARAESRKAESEAKKVEAEARKADTEAKKAEAEAKASKAEDRKADAESRRHLAESKRAEADSRKAEAGSKRAEAEAKEAAAEAKEAKGAEQKLAAERKSEEKRIEAVLRKAEAEVKKVKSEVKKVEAEAKKVEAIARKVEAAAKDAKQKAEALAKKAEAEAKKIEAEKKAAEHRQEVAKSFAKVIAATMSAEKLATIATQRHEFKTETLQPALSVLDRNPKIADMPICVAGGSDICVPAQRLAPAALPTPPTPAVSFLPQIQRKVAIVIGIDQYADPAVPPLESAVKDANAIGGLLQEKFGYEVRVIPNATRADIVKGINAASRSVGPDDSVMIYYAGHGYLMDKSNTGFWIPSDGSVRDPSGWINNDDIARLLNGIPARQVMLVSDSCYSGSLAKEQKITAVAASPGEILARRSVTVMSSGGEEPVSDEGKEGHSIFAWSLMNALKGVDKIEPGSEAFANIRAGVVEEFPQVPQYGAAATAGHTAGGDYLFEVRNYAK